MHGTRGLAETHLQADQVTVVTDASAKPESRAVGERRTRGYLDDFLTEVRGELDSARLTTAQCLRASRLALEAQARANR